MSKRGGRGSHGRDRGRADAPPLPSLAPPVLVDHVIDGSQGEGGGQILRTSLSLAVILGRSVRIHRIRAGRPKPGLARQHLVAVQAAAELGGGVLTGAHIGSTELVYVPADAARAAAGMKASYEFDIGSAGSTSLVLQTILPIILHGCASSGRECAVVLKGGTHNPMSPPAPFLQRCFFPLLVRIGWHVDIELVRHGFFPGGGGCVRVRARAEGAPAPLVLLERGSMRERAGVVLAANIPAAKAEAQASELRAALGWRAREVEVHPVSATGPGNVLYAYVQYEHSAELATQFIECGDGAKSACGVIAREMDDFTTAVGCVGEHLADQLLLPLVLCAGGTYTFTTCSEHFRTNVDVIAAFCGPCAEYEQLDVGTPQARWCVRVRPMQAPHAVSSASGTVMEDATPAAPALPEPSPSPTGVDAAGAATAASSS